MPSGLTDDEVGNLVIEAIDKAAEQAEVGEDIPVQHMPAYPDSPPCKWCERNPENPENIVSDFYSENWVLTMLANGNVQPGFDDPTPHDKALLGLLKYAAKFYGR